MRNKAAADFLEAGLHPYGKHQRLDTKPRKMTVRDTGGVGNGTEVVSDDSLTGDIQTLPPFLHRRDQERGNLVDDHCEAEMGTVCTDILIDDENPFGFELGFDCA